jgi:hypothetical protein
VPKAKRYDAKITFVVEKEVKELLIKYCQMKEFESLNSCIRWILKKYFEILASKRTRELLHSK